MLPGLTTVGLMSAMLGAMTLRRAWYLEHRAGLQLLLRVFRYSSACPLLKASSMSIWPLMKPQQVGTMRTL